MNAETGYPETLNEAIRYFSAGDNAHNFMVALRWPDGVACPTCGATDIRFISTRQKWECKQKHPRRQFSCKVGTIFEDSPVKLDKWFMAMWMLANCKNGVSSYEIMRELGVTQKTGWFMLQRIRAALQSGTIVRDKLTGPVQVDESFIGGKGVAKGRGHAGKGKTGVQGFFAKDKEGHSTVIAEVLEHPGGGLLCRNVRKYVLKGEEIHTDALAGYVQLSQDFIHKVVDHAETYVKDGVTTNGLENFWSLLKRSLKGTYVSVEPFHLFRYLSEQVFRFNERKDDNHGRFLNVVRGAVGKRVTWAQLTGENAGLPSHA